MSTTSSPIGASSLPIVFISYCHADQLSAFAIDQWLRNRGLRVLIDDRDFIPGQDIEAEIVRCIGKAGKVVCLFSSKSASRPWVEFERRITCLLEKEGLGASRRLIYFCLDDSELPPEAKVRVAILAKNLSFQDACDRLWRAVMEHSAEPRDMDLSQFDSVAPWQAGAESRFKRSAVETDDLFARLLKCEDESCVNGVLLIEWLSQGPSKLSQTYLEKIALDRRTFSSAEQEAARIALADLNAGRACTMLLDRVKEACTMMLDRVKEKAKYGETAVSEDDVTVAAMLIVGEILYWSRPTSRVHKRGLKTLTSQPTQKTNRY